MLSITVAFKVKATACKMKAVVVILTIVKKGRRCGWKQRRPGAGEKEDEGTGNYFRAAIL